MICVCQQSSCVIERDIPASKNSCPTSESCHLWINAIMTPNGDRPIAKSKMVRYDCHIFAVALIIDHLLSSSFFNFTGGQIMIVTGESYVADPHMSNFEPRMAELEKEGILIRQKREIWPLYSVGKDGEQKGIVYVLEKQQWSENQLLSPQQDSTKYYVTIFNTHA